MLLLVIPSDSKSIACSDSCAGVANSTCQPYFLKSRKIDIMCDPAADEFGSGQT